MSIDAKPNLCFDHMTQILMDGTHVGTVTEPNLAFDLVTCRDLDPHG